MLDLVTSIPTIYSHAHIFTADKHKQWKVSHLDYLLCNPTIFPYICCTVWVCSLFRVPIAPTAVQGTGGIRTGISHIWLCAESQGFNIDYFTTWKASSWHPAMGSSPSDVSVDDAFDNVPANVPGIIEAEEFDEGGEGVGCVNSTEGSRNGVSSFADKRGNIQVPLHVITYGLNAQSM